MSHATSDDFKAAVRNMANSVSILTHRKDGHAVGMTVSSASSYSAEPPMVFAAINKNCYMATHLSLGDAMAMNLLGSDQQDLAEIFSGAHGHQGEDRFQHGKWTPKGAPVLDGALASFSGILRALIPQASHAMLLIDIHEVKMRAGAPLIYYNRGYHAGGLA